MEEEAQDLAEVLDGWGWQQLAAPTVDTRKCHALAPAEKLQKKHAAGFGMPEGGTEKGWTLAGMRQDDKDVVQFSAEGVERKLISRALERSRAPEADDARQLLGWENPELLQRMTDAQDVLRRRREKRQRQLDRLGIFDKSVNEIRANAMYRVELRRSLASNTLRRKPEAPAVHKPKSAEVSLEQQLHNILDDLACLEPPTEEELKLQQMEALVAEKAAQATTLAASAKKLILPPEAGIPSPSSSVLRLGRNEMLLERASPTISPNRAAPARRWWRRGGARRTRRRWTTWAATARRWRAGARSCCRRWA
jgi:hypothetical protein